MSDRVRQIVSRLQALPATKKKQLFGWIVGIVFGMLCGGWAVLTVMR